MTGAGVSLKDHIGTDLQPITVLNRPVPHTRDRNERTHSAPVEYLTRQTMDRFSNEWANWLEPRETVLLLKYDRSDFVIDYDRRN